MMIRSLRTPVHTGLYFPGALRAGFLFEDFMADDVIQFKAYFPNIQTAIKITGQGDGMRIQLDIPESEIGNAVKLVLMRECILDITIKQADDYPKEPTTRGQNTAPPRTTAKKRK